ncbi:hypothetical protein [Planktothrix paucivesiculata]|uniref:Chromosome segregation ATPase n=1 Tax=Planktothrix paucivesiculata PCC 9631 TaxID=671071 RepID=A0A7Z9BU69_9CYAN|nr:hypothetical protein [Planktothrix paucivesiculata]VXD21364.1 conserved hypothetical protein [Planktothrix paucivesiculata PCC 9631]
MPQFDQTHVPASEPNQEVSSPAPSENSLETAVEKTAETQKSIPLKLPAWFWGWPFLWLIVLLGFGTMGTGALLWLLTMPPVPNCDDISSLSPDSEHLYCADMATKSGKIEPLRQAFALVASWPADHPLQGLAQQKMKEWSQTLIAIAEQKIETGNLEDALAIVKIVPKNTPAYESVAIAIDGWKNNWDRGQKIYDQAKKAMQALDWKQAFEYAQALSQLNNSHWSEKRFNEIMDRLSLERQGNQRLNEARELAKENTPEKLAEAIALANQIDKKLYIQAGAIKEIKNWSRSLLDLAAKQLEEKNLDGLTTIASLVPNYSPLYSEAQNLILMAQVKALSWNQASSKPIWQQMAILWEGQATLDKMGNRPLPYEQAKVTSKEVSGQIQDLVNLQLATAVANVQHPLALQLAIDQAQMITPQQPRRVHAQTLVAHWRKEIQRLEDRPYLALAQRLAQTETPEGYTQAVQQARQVALGRPLRVEAQTLIAEWNKRIEIIEDQPLLNEALALAKAGNLSAAIDKASKIGNRRALHKQAQDKISGWVATVQTAEDRPILDRAYNLAKKGNLSGAIAEASQIRYGRALYSEAQGVVAGWVAERDASIARQAPVEPARSVYQDSYSNDSGNSNYSEPSYSEPSYSEPSYSEPSYSEPSYSEPSYSEPSYSEPSYSEPSYSSEPAAPAVEEVAPAPAPAPAPEAAPEATPAAGNDAPDPNLFLE